MEACLFDVQSLVKTIQSLQLNKVKKNTEEQFLTCIVSTQGIKLSNSTLSRDVYCCSWLRRNVFKKYVYEPNKNNCTRFEICLTTILNCIQVFGLDAKMVILTYDNASLHLSITDDDGAVTDCSLCTYNVSEETDGFYLSLFDLKDDCSLGMDFVIIFPTILRELLKDLCDIGRTESKIKVEFHPQSRENTCIMSFSCSVEGEECVWEFSDDHNVFTGSKIAEHHCHFYSLKSLSQLEKSLSVCSLSRIQIRNNGLLFIQMAIENDPHGINRKQIHNLGVKNPSLEFEEKSSQQFFKTEFVIFPINHAHNV
ncbi:hypothetical protein OJ253_3623 [Cryptosporidium canis]|uniref:Uncharacterized protein n=1 Tax=Cryptosporidium canis TaxID=195482 RepID=A0A9D5DDY1_9CRYT|nr:hypothetical protein OJ253_3623 [Cryptosporidium canis]